MLGAQNRVAVISRVMAIWFACLGMAACNEEAKAQVTKPMTKIVIHTYPGSLISLYPYLGIDLGFYKQEGLDASTLDLNSGPEANAALAGGSIQFVLNTSDNLILAKARGLAVISVVGNQTRNFYSLIVRKDLNIPDKATLKDVAEALNGRRVGINAAGTNGERFAQSLILAGGVDPKNVTFIAVGAPPSALAAFSSNNIDAAFSWEPFQAVSVLKGIGRIAIDCRVAGQCPAALEKPGRAFQTYYTTKAFLDSNKEAVEGFIRAHQKINAWVHDPHNRDALVASVKKLLPPPGGGDIDPTAYAEKVIDGSLDAFGVTIDPAGLDAWNEQLMNAKLISAPVNVTDILWTGAPKP
jgi:NitT/TauT family transport system substrate-binding protein